MNLRQTLRIHGWTPPVVAPIFAASLLYVLLLLYYTHGALLYGGDINGFYSLYQFVDNPNPNTLIFAIGLVLGLGNYYAGLYISLLLSAFLTLFAAYTFAHEAFSGLVESRLLRRMGLLTGILYLLNPVALTDTFKSFTSNVYVENAAFFAFMAELVMLFNSRRGGTAYSLRNVAILGITLGLSLGTFPDNIRIMLVGMIMVAYFLIASPDLRRPDLSATWLAIRARAILIFLAGLIAGGSYSLIPLLVNLHGSIATAAQGATNQGGLTFIQGSFNTAQWVLRLLGDWSFPLGYAPYYGLYVSDPVIVITSYLWPILALGLPLLLSDRRRLRIVAPIVFLMVVMLSWEMAGNPPFGVVYDFIAPRLPFGSQLIPTFFLSTSVLSKLYPLMAAYSIVSIFSWRRGRPDA